MTDVKGRTIRESQSAPRSSHCSCGAWDQEYSELIKEINSLNQKIHELTRLPAAMAKELNEGYSQACESHKKAESKVIDWDEDAATDANLAYWEGQCHAYATLKRALKRLDV
ncbi:hypothetical protein [Crateriforma conspicua]|nr:hypothetical protein [Crateriforma conspicua]